jgi:hypothetical protein
MMLMPTPVVTEPADRMRQPYADSPRRWRASANAEVTTPPRSMTAANGVTIAARHHQSSCAGQGGVCTPTQICPMVEPSAAMR